MKQTRKQIEMKKNKEKLIWIFNSMDLEKLDMDTIEEVNFEWEWHDFCENISEKLINIKKIDFEDFNESLSESTANCKNILMNFSDIVLKSSKDIFDYKKIFRDFWALKPYSTPPTKEQLANPDCLYKYCIDIGNQFVNYNREQEHKVTKKMKINGKKLGELFYKLLLNKAE